MAQLTLRQLREHGIIPDTRLGQHFLVDDNILRVAAEMARLGPNDVCYEPGAGVGVLTSFLAERCAHVHSVEIDSRLGRALEIVCADHPNITMHWGDAMQVHPASLSPQPTKLVSNLPYHVAAPIIAECLQHAPSIRTLVFMVQREVADRMAAPVGGPTYGAVSVLVQALCERTGFHQVSRGVFVPPPNVDSSLVALVRRDVVEGLHDEDVPAFSSFLRECFAQRRKTLANNLSSRAGGRDLVVSALAACGHAPAARAQELSPTELVGMFNAVGRGVG